MAFYLDDIVNEGDGGAEEAFARVAGMYRDGLLEESDEYGSPVLDTVEYGKPVRTVGELKAAFAQLCDGKYANARKFVFFGENRPDGEPSESFMPRDMETVGGKAVMVLAAEKMPPMIGVEEIRHAIASSGDSAELVFQCDGEARPLEKLALEVVRFPDSPDVLHILRFGLGEAAEGSSAAPAVRSVEAQEIPLGTVRFVEECGKMASASGSGNFMKRPMVFEIPSVLDRRFDGKLPDGLPEEAFAKLGTMCTVDIAVKKGGHAEIELMSFDRVKEGMAILNDPGEFSVEGTCEKMRRLGAEDLPLFFMYMRKPYEIEEMKAEAGCPVTCVLAPWGSLDESVKPKFRNEIEQWAAWCREPVLSWRA